MAMRPLKQAPAGASVAYIDAAEWAARTAGESRDILGGMIVEGGMLGAKQIGVSIALDVTNPKVAEHLQEYTFHFGEKITRTTFDKLTTTLTEGLNAGEDIRKLKNRVYDIPQFKAAEAGRAHYSEMVARTESARAQSAGTLEVWRQSGVVEGKEWLCAPDCCAFCAEMDGKIVGLTENYFTEGGALTLDDGRTMKFTYEDVPAVPLHPHCRCTIVAVLIEEGEGQ